LANKAAAEVYGFQSKELARLGIHDIDHLPPEEVADNDFLRLLSTGQTESLSDFDGLVNSEMPTPQKLW